MICPLVLFMYLTLLLFENLTVKYNRNDQESFDFIRKNFIKNLGQEHKPLSGTPDCI